MIKIGGRFLTDDKIRFEMSWRPNEGESGNPLKVTLLVSFKPANPSAMLRTSDCSDVFAPTRFLISSFLVLFGTGVLATSAQAQDSAGAEGPSEGQNRRIIDVHLHALPTNSFPPQADSLVPYERPESAKAVMNQSIDQLQRFGVEKAVTSGTPDLLEDYKEAAPDRIIRSQWVPIGLTGDSLRTYLDSLSHWHEQGRFEVIGEVLTQYSGIAPNDSILNPLWAFAEEEGVPVGIHIGPTDITTPPGEYTPLAMKEVLKEHPELKVYVMHAGYPKLEDMLALLESYPQVYVDVSFINWALPRAKFYSYLRRLIEAGYGDRVMFGSDQMLWPQSIRESIEVIEAADFLTEEQKRAIFYGNAAQFLELQRSEAGDS